MTPRERAEQLLAKLGGDTSSDAIDEIERAIVAAVKAECATCAEIAEANAHARSSAEAIAEKIRERSELNHWDATQ